MTNSQTDTAKCKRFTLEQRYLICLGRFMPFGQQA